MLVTTAAKDLLARLDHVTPANGEDMCAVAEQRGWANAMLYMERNGMLRDSGREEALKLIAATNEWLDGLPSDLVMPPVPQDEGDAPVVVETAHT